MSASKETAKYFGDLQVMGRLNFDGGSQDPRSAKEVTSSSNLSDLLQTIVTLHVGPEYRPFPVHRELLCYASDYFRAALQGNFAEAGAQSLDLKDEEVEVFQKYQTLLYAIVGNGGQEDNDQELSIQWKFESKDDPEWLLLPVKVYCYADKTGSLAIRDAVLRSLRIKLELMITSSQDSKSCFKLFHNMICVEAVEIAWDQLAEGCPLRKLLVGAFAASRPYQSFGAPGDKLRDYPREFLASVCGSLMRIMVEMPEHSWITSTGLDYIGGNHRLGLERYQDVKDKDILGKNVLAAAPLLVTSEDDKDAQIYTCKVAKGEVLEKRINFERPKGQGLFGGAEGGQAHGSFFGGAEGGQARGSLFGGAEGQAGGFFEGADGHESLFSGVDMNRTVRGYGGL